MSTNSIERQFSVFLEMLHYRGDKVPFSVDDLVEASKNSKITRLTTDVTTIVLAIRGNNKDDSNVVFRGLVQQEPSEFTTPRTIMVTPVPYNTFMKQSRKLQLKEKNKELAGVSHIQVISLDDMIVNPFRVPPHQYLIPREEVESVLNKFNVPGKTYEQRIAKLPVISEDDAVARWIGMRPGEVLKVERSSLLTGGTSYYYRVCV